DHRVALAGAAVAVPGQQHLVGRVGLTPVVVRVQRVVPHGDLGVSVQRSGRFAGHLDVGTQVDHPAYPELPYQPDHVGVGQMLQVGRPDQHATPDPSAVRGGQPAYVPDVDGALELDPVGGGQVHRTSLTSGVQNTSSATSISALSVASTTLRRATSSGSTVLAKNRATASLPS